MPPHLWLLKLLWRTIPVSSKSAFKLRLELKGDLSYETTTASFLYSNHKYFLTQLQAPSGLCHFLYF